MRVSDETLALLEKVRESLSGTSHEQEVVDIERRLNGPLRVAIAGRVKAGKSTLLNALVGARLAPTDAGECTKLVSWYRNGQRYQVDAVLHSGDRRQLRFTRQEQSLDVELGELSEDDVDHLDIQWPTSKLVPITLIDTPGLESLNDENSRRARDFLEADAQRGSDVDAVIYLMRHLHTTDVAFLDAYMDRSVPESSPVNAVAVLSRADEVGAGRLDAMASAGRIAERYRTDDQVRGLASTVVPLAGLLAETGLTLREDEATALRSIAELDAETVASMLLSTSHFLDVSASELTVDTRRDLLTRFGMFGVRFAISEIQNGAATASSLAPKLTEASGLHRLNDIIQNEFLPRARILQSRTALVALRGLAEQLDDAHDDTKRLIDHEVERIEATSSEFAQMRAAHLVASGALQLSAGDAEAVERLLLHAPAAEAVGLGPESDDAQLMMAAAEAAGEWRGRANDPLAGVATVEVFEAAARTAESMYAELAAQSAS